MKNPLHVPSTAVGFACLFAALTTLAPAAPKPPLAATPPMGWNSWNWHGKAAITERIVRETIDAMAANGLRDAGYTTIVIDGGWRDTKLGAGGELLAHPVKFPGGIKALADYAHTRGFKFGLHTVPGTHDCGGDPVGGFSREATHVRQFVAWGLDFVKLDRCGYDPGWDEPTVETVYRRWGGLLAGCGRDIVLNISAYRYRRWYPEVSHMARTTYDIQARVTGGAVFDLPDKPEARNFLSVMAIAELNDQVADFARPGYWNDPDMLATGPQGMNAAEQRAHFALWCVMSAPLFIGSDPRTMDAGELALLSNRDALAVNQDPTEQGRKLIDNGMAEIWAKKLRGGRVAVLLLNRDPGMTKKISFAGKSVGLPAGWQGRDVFAGTAASSEQGDFAAEVGPHACVLLLLSPR
jgi:alpha-galactosidase